MSSQEVVTIRFQPVGKRVTLPAGQTLLDAARQAGIDLTSACGGEGNCGQCQVVPLDGSLSPLAADEEFFISDADRAKGYRLACCTRALSDLTVQLPADSLITGQRLQVESRLRNIPADPLVRVLAVEMDAPTLEDSRADFDRLADALSRQHNQPHVTAALPMLRSVPVALRAAQWRVNVALREHEVAAVLPPETRPLGLAVDLGTTKLAARLVDLLSGEALASAGAPNPQIGYGEDLITRLNLALRPPSSLAPEPHNSPTPNSQLLAFLVRRAIDDLLGELTGRLGVARSQVVEAVIVGNTAMTHLLLEYPVRQLATAPYVAASNQALDLPAGELGLNMAPGASVHIPAGIGGYVGADHVAMSLACDMDETPLVTLGLDIGTNTEISLRLPGRPELLAVSCASGPAFEGAHIRDGMRAASGAIEKVRITPHGLDLTTIDDLPAVGLCGSGILDAIAELHRAGAIDDGGRFRKDYPGVRPGDLGPEFVLVPAQRSGSGRDIVLTQHDVNEIQLAKGAISAGLSVLLEASDTPPEAVQEVIVAGAFGSFINIPNAVAIGLFPHLPNAAYRQVGNAAALGAQWILISRRARERAKALARHTRYLELTTFPKFSRRFALAMRFPSI